jgi:hypothetical protein
MNLKWFSSNSSSAFCKGLNDVRIFTICIHATMLPRNPSAAIEITFRKHECMKTVHVFQISQNKSDFPRSSC